MVRHPKKKDEENPPQGDSPSKDGPPSEPAEIESDEDRIRSGLNRVFWMRVGLGILAGGISAIFGDPLVPDQRIYAGFGIMIVMFIVSYVVAKSFRVPLLPQDRRKLATTGYGSYFLMFIFSWILINTVLHAAAGSAVVH
ncbi:MAG: hypothetical protein KGI33_06835 [Thaumarchaeota archaeon]|nr:hypothetical protein [Nitrososphaerota archaeon]